MKKELLSPVGNYESLIAAIHNGCDAVYLGGKKFGARAYSNNFNNEEMIKAIKYCHLYNVKIYVTVNTLIYETEINEVIDYLRFLHQNNVDAVIMQDLGLITLIREKFPNLEIHASTQMHNHNIEQLKLLEQLGVKRVVLDRELSLEQINNLDTSLELEAFIHGALCVCFSGQCLFSSLLMDRSGNRGCCAGICRLPFKLYENDLEIPTNGNYLLSPKELNTIDYFEDLKNSKIVSFKIEGRMKSPEYVGLVTRLYRKLLDNEVVTEEDKQNLKVLFNREFTKGFLFKENSKDIMNIKTPNHQGIVIGKVIDIKKDKIKIKLSEDLKQNDGIRFKEEDKGFMVNFLYNEKMLLINKAFKNDYIYVDNKINLKEKCTVLKTIDSKLNLELNNYKEKKIKIDVFVKAKLNENLKVTFKSGENKVEYIGGIVEKSLNNSLNEEIIKEKLTGLGSTPFVLNEFNLENDPDIFIPMSELKNIKRKLTEDLKTILENIIPHPFVEIDVPKKQVNNNIDNKINLNVLVRNEEQLLCCLENNIDNIYVTSEKLYEKYKNYSNVYLRLDRVYFNFKERNNEKLLITELGGLENYNLNNEIVIDYYLNVTNSYTFNYLSKYAKRITLSVENKFNDIKNIVNNIDKSKVELFLYGKPEVMVMKYCPLNNLVNKDSTCHVCQNNKNYYLSDFKNKYKILSNPLNHITHLFYYEEIDLTNNLNEFINMGIKNFRIELLDENREEIKSIVCKIK